MTSTQNIATVKFDDQLGSRGIRHMNLLVASLGDQAILFEFKGESIHGVAQILSTNYKKNGKWSHSTWEVELSHGIRSFVWHQDWETGQYITAGTRGRAIEDIRLKAGIPDLCPAAIERFIRARLPNTSAKLDRAKVDAKADPTEALKALLEAQAELAKAQAEEAEMKQEVLRLEEAEKAKEEAKAIKSRVAAARQAMAKGASLADLRALMEGSPG